MSTHRIPILGSGTIPDSSGNVFFEPFNVKATTDNWDRLVLIFNDDSSVMIVHGGFTVPKNYNGSPKIIVLWTSTATASDVDWDFSYRAVAATQDLDDTVQETVSQDDNAAPGTTLYLVETAITLSANFAADDEVEFQFKRDGVSDGMAAAAIVFAVLFEYTDA